MSECYCVIEILVEKADRDLLEGPEDPTSYHIFIDFNISVIKWLRQQYYLPLWSNNFVWRLHTLALNPRAKRVSLKTTSKKHDLQIQVKNHLAFTIHFHIIIPTALFLKGKVLPWRGDNRSGLQDMCYVCKQDINVWQHCLGPQMESKKLATVR